MWVREREVMPFSMVSSPLVLSFTMTPSLCPLNVGQQSEFIYIKIMEIHVDTIIIQYIAQLLYCIPTALFLTLL